MNKYKTLAFNTLFISFGTFGSKLLVFIMVRFYTEYLTPADYGTADLLTQTANLLIPVFSLGITDGVFRFAIDRNGARASVFTSGFYTITAGCFLLFSILPLLGLIPTIHGYAWLIAGFVAASCYHALCAQFIRAEGNTALFAIQGLINTMIVIVLNIIFLVVFQLGIIGYVLSVVVANLITMAMLVLKGKLWRQITTKPHRGIWMQMLRYSIPLIPTTVFWWITGVSDRYLISAFMGDVSTGIYSVAYKIPTIITIISTAFMDAWLFSSVTEFAGDRQEHIQFYSKVWNAFYTIMFLCGAVVIAFSQMEIRILAAENFYSAWAYIPLLSMSMVFASFASFTGSVYVVTKKSNLSLWTAMLGAAINIVLNLILIPTRLGVQGAAIATFASYLIVFIVRAASVRKYIPFHLCPVRLIAHTFMLAVQTIFIVFHLPKWQLVQVAGITLLFLMGYKTLLTGAYMLGLPVPSRWLSISHTDKGESNDTDSI